MFKESDEPLQDSKYDMGISQYTKEMEYNEKEFFRATRA